MAEILPVAGMIEHPNLLASFRQGQQYGQAQLDRRNMQQVGQLYGQAMTASPDQRAPLLSQISQLGGMEAAGSAQAGLGKMDDNARDDLTRSAAEFVALADQPDMAAQLYPQLAAKAHAVGIPVPTAYDPKMLPAIQKIASMGQHQQQLAPHVIGNSLVDNTGKVLYQGQPQSRMQVVNVPDGQGGSVQMMLDPGTGRFTPPNYGGDAPVDPIPGASATPHSLLDPTKDYPQLASAYGATPTSLYRTPQHNAEVGGVPNSQHLRGTAGDFVVPPDQRQQFIDDARARGYQPIDEGNHVHLQLPRGAQAAETFGPGQRLGYTPPKAQGGGALQERIDLARRMGASEDQIRQLVLGGQAGQGVASVPGDPSKTGDAYLATLPPEMRNVVKAIANGDQPPPSSSSRSPQAQALLQAVYQYDPSANAINLPARTQTRKDFTSGKSAQNLRSLNQAIGHLGLLNSQISGTAGHAIPLVGQYVNAAENAYHRQSGDPGITNYEQTAEALAGELTQVFRGNAGAEADIKRNLEHLASSQSTEQKQATVRNIVGLLRSRIEELGQQYNQGMGKTTDPYSLLNAHALQVLNQIGGASGGSGAAPAARSGPQPGTIEDGHRFKGGNPADPNNWEAVR